MAGPIDTPHRAPRRGLRWGLILLLAAIALAVSLALFARPVVSAWRRQRARALAAELLATEHLVAMDFDAGPSVLNFGVHCADPTTGEKLAALCAIGPAAIAPIDEALRAAPATTPVTGRTALLAAAAAIVLTHELGSADVPAGLLEAAEVSAGSEDTIEAATAILLVESVADD